MKNFAEPLAPEAAQSWISRERELKSGADWLSCAAPEEVEAFLEGLSDAALAALPWLFEFWALPHQLPPEGGWKTWVILGGRGAGKTRAGAEWVRRQVEGPGPRDAGRASRVALVGETLDQVREVMVMGESGLIATSPPDRRPVWEASRRRLVWPNGAVATAYSAHDPDSLRGPQFDAAWVDELAKWPKADRAWDMLQFALRLGAHPQQVVTTTPQNVAVLKQILSNPSTVRTHAPTSANRAYLAESYLAEVQARYGGTRLGAQELEGLLLEDVEGALWTTAQLSAAQVSEVPELERVVVAVDPSASEGGDECGIVVAGLAASGDRARWRAYVLEDASLTGSPLAWAEAAVAAARRHGASRVVIEGNQGGAMAEATLRSVDPALPIRRVSARVGKGARAEPVSALYEQGRVLHAGRLARLEDQMCRMTAQGYRGKGSPDRLDALVWALTDLVLEPAARGAVGAPRVRVL